MTKTLKLRIKDKHAAVLRQMAREVNQVFNFCNETSIKAIREKHQWLSGYDLLERIYGWLNGHLSIARFYGGITVNGNFYTIAYNEPDSPLVRFDVLKREAKDKRAAKKAEKGTLL